LQGFEIRDEAKYPEAEYRYFTFAKEFGWTPDQVDCASAVTLDWMMQFLRVNSEVENERRDQH